MWIALAIVSGLNLFTTILCAVALFTDGWLYAPNFYGYEEGLGIVPYIGSYFDSTDGYGWLVATSIFMYLTFTCHLISCIACLVSILLFLARGDHHYQVIALFTIASSTFICALFGAVAFIIFVANYDSFLYGFSNYITIGFSPFFELAAIVFSVIGTGVSAFFAIALNNGED